MSFGTAQICLFLRPFLKWNDLLVQMQRVHVSPAPAFPNTLSALHQISCKVLTLHSVQEPSEHIKRARPISSAGLTTCCSLYPSDIPFGQYLNNDRGKKTIQSPHIVGRICTLLRMLQRPENWFCWDWWTWNSVTVELTFSAIMKFLQKGVRWVWDAMLKKICHKFWWVH